MCEGHSQFLVMALAAAREGSAKMRTKAADPASRRHAWEPQAPALDPTVAAFAGDLCCGLRLS